MSITPILTVDEQMGCIGFRIVERYRTLIHSITIDYINYLLTLDEAVDQIQEQLPLYLVLIDGKLISDVARIGSTGYWIYELINLIGLNLSKITIVNSSQEFFDRLALLGPNILLHFSDKSLRIYPGLNELGIVLLSIFAWIIDMIKVTGSFFWTEILKYYLAIWAAFHSAVHKWCKFGSHLSYIWRRYYPRIVLSDPLNLNNRINNNLRTHFGQSRDIPHEDNQIPDEENICSLVDSIRRNQEEILCLRVKNEQFVKQLEEIKTRMQQVQNLTKIDVSMTLEEINTGLIKRIRRKVIHIPPGCLGGTEIPVYPNGNDQSHLNNIPLFIVRIQELPHPLFQRDRQNLICTATVDLSFVYKKQCRTLRVPSIDSESFYEIEFEENDTIQANSQCTISLAGLPNEINTETRGDLIIKFKFQIPTSPDEFLALVQQFEV